MIDHTLEADRIGKLRASIAAAGCDAGLFYDPINIRYATGTSNMSVYSLHNPCRYVFVPAEGDIVLFDFKGCEHLSVGHEAIAETRTAVSWYDFITGQRTEEFARIWADELIALLGPGQRDIAVDRLDPIGTNELQRRGIRLHDGQAVANRARAIKSGAEVIAVKTAIEACEDAMALMQTALVPGITELQLWAHLHQANIAAGGEWLETRLLTSGHRTNPWYQEASHKVIEAGDLVAFDTDLIGIGLCNEYPLILNKDHFEGGGYDGEVKAGMVLCVEALAAPPGGDEGVKLEEQILVTNDGPVLLSTYSLDL